VAIVVEGVPVVFRWVTRVTAPLKVLLGHAVLHHILNHAPREHAVKFSLEVGQVVGQRLSGPHCVVEDGLLVGLAPSVRPIKVYSLRFHSEIDDTIIGFILTLVIFPRESNTNSKILELFTGT
jgi:hypothetical protein